jgi:O-antigen ligase
MGLLSIAAFRLPMMRNRLAQSAQTGNMAGRERLYPALWAMFQERPVVGWGPVLNLYELAWRVGERKRPWRGAHNFVLELLTATGLVGTIPFLVGTWLCARGAWRARVGEHGVLPLALLCSLLIANMAGDWMLSKLFWLVLAYTLVSGEWGTRGEALRSVKAPLQPLPTASRGAQRAQPSRPGPWVGSTPPARQRPPSLSP